MKKPLTLIFGLFIAVGLRAQTADEIIAKYFENTGGLDKWKSVQGYRMTGKFSQQGQEFPLAMVQLKDGRQYQSITLQGKEVKQQVYDGTTLWSHNYINMKAEKSDAESTENFKANLNSDFPIPFMGYKEKGFKVELLGKETVEGTETFKVKLTKKPIKVDGKPKDNVEFYYFDAENFVPLMMESEINSGPAKGMTAQIKFSDYQEANGVMFPFSISQGAKGQPAFSVTITFSKVDLISKAETSDFAFPSGN